MQERMYNVIRYNRVDKSMPQNYLIKKHDIIKMGRVKIKVKDFYSVDKINARKLKV